MPTFGDLASELAGRLPGLSPLLAETFITRAWATIRNERMWSFLTFDGAVVCPALVSTGSFSITRYSATVTANAAASAALAAITGVGVTSLQIRFMGLGQTSQIYSITTYDVSVPTAAVLTLDRVVQEPTNTASQYMVYRAYIVPPMTDFLCWESIDDMVNGFAMTKGRLSLSSAYFDVRDPQRQAFGLAYYCGFYQAAGAVNVTEANAAPKYELWPGSTQGQNFYVRFRRRGLDPAMTDALPPQIPSALVVQDALASYGYPHVAANVGLFPAFKNVQFPTLMLAARSQYAHQLTLSKTQDDEQALQTVFNRGHGLRRGNWGRGGPPVIDSNWMQSHPVTW